MNSDEAVAIRLIGEVRVVHDGHVVHPRVVGGGRCVNVLAYLAVNRNREVPHDELASIVWPRNRPQSWYAALRGVLSRVRDTLELATMPADSVRSRGGHVRLSLPDGAITDVELVRRYCVAAVGDVGLAVANARRALELTAEPTLVGAVGTWADEVRTHVEQLRRRAFDVDASGSLSVGDHARAVTSAEALLALDPLRESAYRTAMSGYLSLGERGRALQVAARCRRVLDENLGVAPSAETEALYLEILRTDEASPAESRLAPVADVDFVGRRSELLAIDDALRRADRGRGQFVVITGEAGSGKTTLAREVMKRARATGADVLFGRCSDEAVVPLEPFVEAIGRELEALPPAKARAWLRTTGSDVLRLAPSLARRIGETVPARPEGDERAAIMTAVLDWLTSSTRSGPTVLIIDDLHWSSAATLAVLRYLVHASEQSRLCVIATVRDEHADGGYLRATLSAPTRTSGVQRVSLGGLSLAEVGALVDASGVTLDPHTLYDRTHGLPLFVVSLINSNELGSAETFPATVADSVAQRQRLLPTAALTLLQLCSVVGMVVPRLLLRTAAEFDDVAFADALDVLMRNQLVTETSPGADIRLRHPLVQEAVYAGIGGRRRLQMHTRVALTLELLGDASVAEEYSRLAYHFSRGLDSERPRAAHFSKRAGDSAMSIGAYEDAVVFYASAIEHMIPRGDSAPRCQLLVDLGRAQRKARDDAFRPTLFEAVAMAKRLGDNDLQISATLANDQPGTLYSHIHYDHERVDTLYDALHVLEAEGRAGHAATALVLAQLAIELVWVADSRALKDLLTRSTATARAAGERDALVSSLFAVLVVLRVPWFAEFRSAAYAELTGLLDELATRRVDPLVSVWIARHEIEHGRLAAASLIRSTLTDGRLSRDPELVWLVSNVDFAIDLAAGNLPRCEAKFDALRDVPASPGVTYSYGRLLGQLFALRTLRGDMREIVAAAEDITERFDVVATYRACLATAHVDVGNLDAAVGLVGWYDERRIGEIPVNNMWLSTMATIGRAAAQVDAIEVCAIIYDLLSQYAGENTISWASVYGVVDHHLAELSIALRRYDQAALHLDAALAAHEQRGFRGWLAESAYLAILLESRRDGSSSTTTVTRARRLADDAGATAVLRRIDGIPSSYLAGNFSAR